MEAGALTTWLPQIFETNTFDLISRDEVADRARVLVRRGNCKRSSPTTLQRRWRCDLLTGDQERAIQHHDNGLPSNEVAVVRLEAVHEAVTSEVAPGRRSGS